MNKRMVAMATAIAAVTSLVATGVDASTTTNRSTRLTTSRGSFDAFAQGALPSTGESDWRLTGLAALMVVTGVVLVVVSGRGKPDS